MVFRKVLFMIWNISIFSFIEHIVKSFFKKTDNWWEIYKQTSLTFYWSNDVSKSNCEEKVMMMLMRFTPIQDGSLITIQNCVHETDKN